MTGASAPARGELVAGAAPRALIATVVEGLGLSIEDRETARLAALDDKAISKEPGWLQAFVRRAWAIIDPDLLVWNWHYSLLCAEIERVLDGRTRELVISIPPGCGKSILMALVSAAIWLHNPGFKLLAIAHIPKNVLRDSKRHRDVVTSAWYRGLVERLAREQGIGLVEEEQRDGSVVMVPWTLAKDQNEKANFENTAHGSREIGTVGGGITGTRCGGLITDDCYDAKEATQGTPAQVAEHMQFVVDEYDSNWLNRVHPLYGWRINIMQGLAEGDLADVLVKRGVRRVILPMVYEADVKVTVTRPGQAPVEEPLYHPRDPRKPGELLFPWLYSAEWCATMRGTAAGARIWGPQYQQVRGSLGGKLFPRIWFDIPATRGVGAQRYQGPPAMLARGLDHIAISVDCSFSDTKKADRVAIHAWGYKDANRFLLDRVADQMTIGGTIAAVIAMRARWNAIKPGVALVRFVLIEKKANGAAVIDLFEGQISAVIGYNPQTSKFGRAQIASYKYQAGNVWLPMPEHAPWVGEFVELHVNFTGAAGGADDDIDAESQFMIHLDDADAVKPDDTLARITGGMGFLGRKR